MSKTREKVRVTFLDQETAKTVGWPLHYAASQLGVWSDKQDDELYELFDRWLDRSMYDLCVVWERGKKVYRVFKRGFTISDQIDTAIGIIASCGCVEIDFREIFKHVKFIQKGVYDEDVRKTFYHNMKINWLATDIDYNYWIQFLSEDEDGKSPYPPALPSSRNNAFKAGFDSA